MDLLTNAIESIQAGIEDYEVGSRPRLLSAVRNIHAGMLLLFKEELRRRSPAGTDEVLVRAKMVPVVDPSTGKTSIVGKGKKTATTQEIKERLDGLGVVVDWPRFDKIASLRNDIEHYYPQLTQSAVQGLIASAFMIVRSFCVTVLSIDPRVQLGEATWKAMLSISEVYDAEKADCDAALHTVEWNSDTLSAGVGDLRCAACGSDLLTPVVPGATHDDVELKCRHCGAVKDTQATLEEAVSSALAWEAYVAVTDGGDNPYAECSECGFITYVYAEEECLHCGSAGITDCARCGSKIPASEMGTSPLCGYCDHVTSKDD